MYHFEFVRVLVHVENVRVTGELCCSDSVKHNVPCVDRTNVYCLFKCVKFWVKLVSLPDGCLLKSCYKMLYDHCRVDRQN